MAQQPIPRAAQVHVSGHAASRRHQQHTVRLQQRHLPEERAQGQTAPRVQVRPRWRVRDERRRGQLAPLQQRPDPGE